MYSPYSFVPGIVQPDVELHSNGSDMHASYAYTRSGSPHNVIHSASFTVLWFCRVIRVSTRPHPLCNCSYIVSTSHHVLDMYISSFSGSAYEATVTTSVGYLQLIVALHLKNEQTGYLSKNIS